VVQIGNRAPSDLSKPFLGSFRFVAPFARTFRGVEPLRNNLDLIWRHASSPALVTKCDHIAEWSISILFFRGNYPRCALSVASRVQGPPGFTGQLSHVFGRLHQERLRALVQIQEKSLKSFGYGAS